MWTYYSSQYISTLNTKDHFEGNNLMHFILVCLTKSQQFPISISPLGRVIAMTLQIIISSDKANLVIKKFSCSIRLIRKKSQIPHTDFCLKTLKFFKSQETPGLPKLQIIDKRGSASMLNF